MTDYELKELYIKGAIVGQLVGDALGYHYRFAKYSSPPNLRDITMLPGPQEYRHEGIYTNSAALGIATMASLNESGQVDIDDMLERFYETVIGGSMNYDSEDYYISSVSSQAIKNFSNGHPWDKCGIREKSPEDEDEVLLRVLPLALWALDAETNDFIELMHKACIITHNTVQAQICTTLYAMIARNLLLQKAEKVFDVLGCYYEESNKEDFVCDLLTIRQASESAQYSGIVATFWNAWKVFSSNQNDYINAVRKSTRFPNPNVVAGVVGSWAALQTGLNDIPMPWLHTLKLSGEAMETIETFVQKVIKKMEGK